ncbi:pre-mrna processing factor 4-like protein [Penicillium digitatum]|uniref:Uncharacterized protein n=3 Tax=Penicillium digitatum TaxID=36651 RepID=K9GAV9_PEND2|nr:hypothetical protein PDIP_10400 [Penicillium digitatum Pd1]EKV19075.1 hypothetical protein PDIG_05720 [Penicillium digitatum PHI26]EKV20984.1 hypothetical protein PDIP_10400 [Penicillium digitatum Pd1]QQK48311.1 pre-mrna processing factor 4-like protein [Penicillium digitatum]
MSTTKPSFVEEESHTTPTPTPTKKSFGTRLAAHVKKWWWVHLIISIACFLIILLPVVYVAYPKIAQDAVNDSTLAITDMILSNPTPKSFHLQQRQVLGSHSLYHPHLYAFDSEVSLAGAADPFAHVTVPAVKSKDGAVIHIEQKVDLTDASAFGDFSTAVMLNEEVSWKIYGRPGLKQGGLPKTTVTYNKTVVMKGLNKLKGFTVAKFFIMFPPVNGFGMNGTVTIPNASVLTIPLGNVTLNLELNGRSVGTTYLSNLTLKPGNNTVPMIGQVDQAAIITLLTSPSNPYKDGIMPFDITGNATSTCDGKELPYFSKALAANKLSIKLDVLSALKEAGLHLTL